MESNHIFNQEGLKKNLTVFWESQPFLLCLAQYYSMSFLPQRGFVDEKSEECISLILLQTSA